MRLRFLEGLREVDARAWDALAGEDDPFAEHAFLETLEASGSVGERAGWRPRHVTAWDGDRLVGALPVYVKDHSYGEYIFDWAWADASERAGIPYYPKLVSMAPLTPATGRRLLIAPDVERAAVVAKLRDGVEALAGEERASSAHLLFLSEAERDDLARDGRWLARKTYQFHFHNDGYERFDDFLARCRSASRKQIRRERREVVASGLDVYVLTGDAITEEHVATMDRFYRDTCARKGSYPYLTPAFFALAAERLRHRMVLVFAFDGPRVVAGSLSFAKGRCLYGRYWGALSDYDKLHFEICFYRLQEWAIERKVARFEAGAQGPHKLRRGFLPAVVHSAHWIAHPMLRAAVGDFVRREAAHTEHVVASLATHGPFRRACE